MSFAFVIERSNNVVTKLATLGLLCFATGLNKQTFFETLLIDLLTDHVLSTQYLLTTMPFFLKSKHKFVAMK